MAIKQVTENWEDRTVTDTESGKQAVRTFTVDFDELNNPAARPVLALRHAFIPKRGSMFPYDRAMFVDSRTVAPGEGPLVFKVTCNYITKTTGISVSGSSGASGPLSQKPEISWTFATSEEPIDRDINGKPILNSAQESFDPPISQSKDDLVLRYVRNERFFNPRFAMRFKGAVNSSTFLGVSPGLVKCTVFDGDKVYDNEFSDYFVVTYEFQFRLGMVAGKQYGWLRRILDQGFRELLGKNEDGTPIWENIKDNAGNPLSEPALLNGSGRELALQTPPKGHFLKFQTHHKQPFSALNIRI